MCGVIVEIGDICRERAGRPKEGNRKRHDEREAKTKEPHKKHIKNAIENKIGSIDIKIAGQLL